MARNKYAIARHSILYIMRILIVTVAIILLSIGVFTMGMYTSNIYIILMDGMDLRAECILKNGSLLELTNYFTEKWINSDAKLYENAYADFTISSYDYRVEIKRLIALPWSTKVEVEVIEKMASVAYSVNASAGDDTLPEWSTGRCIVTFVKEDAGWFIDDITLVERNPQEEALPTPDMSLLPN